MPASRPNSDFVYELPYAVGSRFLVCQGYGGAYSHTGDRHFSVDFAMPEKTPIFASRSGVVYSVVDHFTAGGAGPSFKPKWNAIHVLHGDDTIATYGHLAHRGALVRAAEVSQPTVRMSVARIAPTKYPGNPQAQLRRAQQQAPYGVLLMRP